MAIRLRAWAGPLIGSLLMLGILAMLLTLARAFFVGGPWHITKTLAVTSLALATAAAAFVPLAWAERAHEKRFTRLLAALLDLHSGAPVTPHEDDRGRGYAIATPTGPVLLLLPPGALGPAVLITEDGRELAIRAPSDLPRPEPEAQPATPGPPPEPAPAPITPGERPPT